MTKDELIGDPQDREDIERIEKSIADLEEAKLIMLDGFSRKHIQLELVASIVSLHLLLDNDTKELIRKDIYE